MSWRAVLAHCWTGTPEQGWYPKAVQAFAARGIALQVPALPDTDQPVLSEWLTCLSQSIGETDDRLMLIGHSLGALTVLHWLARYEGDTRVAGVMLVAPPIHATGIEEVDRFLAPTPDLQRARRAAERIDAVFSQRDPYLRPDPKAVAWHLRSELGARVQLVTDRSHFAPASGHAPFPELQQWVDEIVPIQFA